MVNIGCCKAHIEWLKLTNHKNLFGSCSEICDHVQSVPYESCCLSLVNDLHNLCFRCINILSDILVQKLHTIVVSQNGSQPDL